MFFADPARGELVLSGSSPNWSASDTWSWDGNAWILRQPATPLPVRSNVASTFDPARGLGLVFGGFHLGQFLDELWAWDGDDWSPVPVSAGPGARAGGVYRAA